MLFTTDENNVFGKFEGSWHVQRARHQRRSQEQQERKPNGRIQL